MAELSVRYATALFDLAEQGGMLDEFLEQAVAVRDALRTGDSRSVMEQRKISSSEKSEFLETALAGRVHDDLLGFLHMLIVKDSANLIVPALSTFINMGALHSGKTVATVFSAAELDKTRVSVLESALSKKLGKRVEVSVKVDPSLIGGLCVQVDGRMIDHTVKKHLTDLRDSIKRGDAV